MFSGEGDDHFLEKKKFDKEYTQGWLQGSSWIGVNSTGTPQTIAMLADTLKRSMPPANTELFIAYLAYWMPWGTCMWFGLGIEKKNHYLTWYFKGTNLGNPKCKGALYYHNSKEEPLQL